MNGFLDIESVRVPAQFAEEANEFLRHAGSRQCEGFVLWVGNREGLVFHVRETVIPAQTAHITDDGVCVSVDADELHRLNVMLYMKKMNIIAQLHSHPGAAYHSETDDSFPIATTTGCLSIVIPDFARFSFSFSRCAVYRLNEQAVWSFLPSHQAEKLITIVR